MTLHHGKAPYRDHLCCRTEEDLDGLLDEHREAAEAMIADSRWPGFQRLVVVCVDLEQEVVVGVTSAVGDDVLFLVDEDRQGEGIGQLMVEAMILDLPEEATEQATLDEVWFPPWTAIAGSEEGASFLASLPNKFGWKAFALIEWSGYDEEKELWREHAAKEARAPRVLPPLWNDHQFAEICLYRWSDGSDAVLSVNIESGEVALVLRWVYLPKNWIDPVTGEDDFPEFAVDGPTEGGGRRVLTRSHGLLYEAELERKMLGLFLDLGVERPYPGPGLVNQQAGDTPFARYPRFVPDEVWAGRYDEAYKLVDGGVAGGTRNFLGVVDRISVHRGLYEKIKGDARGVYKQKEPEGFTVMWGTLLESSTWSRELGAAILECLLNEFILPESAKERWESAHVERGELVALSAEELELYRMLGELPPIWWSSERLVEWIREKKP